MVISDTETPTPRLTAVKELLSRMTTFANESLQPTATCTVVVSSHEVHDTLTSLSVDIFGKNNTNCDSKLLPSKATSTHIHMSYYDFIKIFTSLITKGSFVDSPVPPYSPSDPYATMFAGILSPEKIAFTTPVPLLQTALGLHVNLLDMRARYKVVFSTGDGGEQASFVKMEEDRPQQPSWWNMSAVLMVYKAAAFAIFHHNCPLILNASAKSYLCARFYSVIFCNKGENSYKHWLYERLPKEFENHQSKALDTELENLFRQHLLGSASLLGSLMFPAHEDTPTEFLSCLLKAEKANPEVYEKELSESINCARKAGTLNHWHELNQHLDHQNRHASKFKTFKVFCAAIEEFLSLPLLLNPENHHYLSGKIGPYDYSRFRSTFNPHVRVMTELNLAVAKTILAEEMNRGVLHQLPDSSPLTRVFAVPDAQTREVASVLSYVVERKSFIAVSAAKTLSSAEDLNLQVFVFVDPEAFKAATIGSILTARLFQHDLAAQTHFISKTNQIHDSLSFAPLRLIMARYLAVVFQDAGQRLVHGRNIFFLLQRMIPTFGIHLGAKYTDEKSRFTPYHHALHRLFDQKKSTRSTGVAGIDGGLRFTHEEMGLLHRTLRLEPQLLYSPDESPVELSDPISKYSRPHHFKYSVTTKELPPSPCHDYSTWASCYDRRAQLVSKIIASCLPVEAGHSILFFLLFATSDVLYAPLAIKDEVVRQKVVAEVCVASPLLIGAPGVVSISAVICEDIVRHLVNSDKKELAVHFLQSTRPRFIALGDEKRQLAKPLNCKEGQFEAELLVISEAKDRHTDLEAMCLSAASYYEAYLARTGPQKSSDEDCITHQARLGDVDFGHGAQLVGIFQSHGNATFSDQFLEWVTKPFGPQGEIVDPTIYKISERDLRSKVLTDALNRTEKRSYILLNA